MKEYLLYYILYLSRTNAAMNNKKKLKCYTLVPIQQKIFVCVDR